MIKKSTENMVTTFVERTVDSQKTSFTEEEIIKDVFKAFFFTAKEKKVVEGIVKKCISNFINSGMIKTVKYPDFYEKV